MFGDNVVHPKRDNSEVLWKNYLLIVEAQHSESLNYKMLLAVKSYFCNVYNFLVFV